MPFQSTPLREGRRQTPQPGIKFILFQSTPLREGRLMIDMYEKLSRVSIHAPA